MPPENSQSDIHILVVDDRPQEIRSYIQDSGGTADGKSVSLAGRVLTFAYRDSLEPAYDVLRFAEEKVDVILLDIRFPEKRDGYWLLEKIVHMSTDLGVVVLTGHPGQDEAFRAGKLRADQFVSKDDALRRTDGKPDSNLLDRLVQVYDAHQAAPELHDRRHLEVVDPFAPEYDLKEQSYPATVAYYVFENEIIRQLVADALRAKDEVRVCDIGCGTGRIEELLVQAFPNDQTRLYIDAVDFSGRMLARLRDKNVRRESREFTIRRGSAERLSMLRNEQQDVVLMGFGVPSYTKYHLSLTEAARICRRGGYALFSAYNERSLVYDASVAQQWAADDRPVAALADPNLGTLLVGPDNLQFACETFTCDAFRRLVERAGFVPIELMTFPTLHVALPRKAVAAMQDAGRTREEFPHCETFSQTLYDLDRTVSSTLKDRGHYIVVTARRQ